MELYLMENLGALRRARGMSPRQLAEALCCSARRVEQWEDGTAEPSCGQLLQLAEIFGVSLEALLTRAQDPAPADTAYPPLLTKRSDAATDFSTAEVPQNTAPPNDRDASEQPTAESAAVSIDDAADELFDLMSRDVFTDTARTLTQAKAFEKSLRGLW